jgi:AraC-like DNA-binding protein
MIITKYRRDVILPERGLFLPVFQAFLARQQRLRRGDRRGFAGGAVGGGRVFDGALHVDRRLDFSGKDGLLRCRRLAQKYLREDYSVEQITYLLGFSEPSVFRKAFKKWSGVTPREYREMAYSSIRQ